MAKRACDYAKLGGGYLQREKKQKEEHEESHGPQQQSGLASYLVP